MQEDEAKESSGAASAERRTLWQRLTGNGGPSGLPMLVKIAIGIIVVAILVVVIRVLYANVPAGESPGAAIDYPTE